MDILNILKAEKDLLYEIIELLEEEKQALIKNNIEKIQQFAAKKEELKIRADEAEKQRMEACGSLKLKDIVSSMEEPYRKQAEDLGRDLEKAVREIQKANELNRMLLKQSLDYVRMMINVISPPKVSVYNTKGKVEGSFTDSRMLNTSI